MSWLVLLALINLNSSTLPSLTPSYFKHLYFYSLLYSYKFFNKVIFEKSQSFPLS